MKTFLFILLIGALQVFAVPYNWYSAKDVTSSEDSLEFHTDTQLISDNNFSDYGIEIKLHTFSSKAEPENWVIMEIGNTNSELGCFSLHDIDVRGIGLSFLIKTPGVLTSENNFYHHEYLSIQFTRINSQTGAKENGIREITIIQGKNSCDVQVELR